MKDWDEMSGHEARHKPRIVDFVDTFEKKYKGTMPDEFLTNAACMGVVLFFFGPLEDEEAGIYGAMVKKRVEDYRNSLH